MRYLDPPIAELLAAEYVLGTLKGQARQRFERLLQAHPGLRSRVRAWELRLNRLAESLSPVPPPVDTWNGLQKKLFAAASRQAWSVRLWRGLALASGLASAVLAVLLFFGLPAQEAAYLVMISSTASQQPVWIASTSADRGRIYVKNMKPMNMPADKRCLLWLRPEGTEDYYALGSLPDKGDDRTLEISRDMRAMLPGSLLVTVEQMSDSIPPRPSGPPLYQGEWMAMKI